MNILNAQKLSKSYGPYTLFQNLDFTINDGEKVGVIGPNGCGKSTLFQILVGKIEADDGIVSRRRGMTHAYISQTPDFDPNLTPAEVVAESMGSIRDAIQQFHDLSAQISEASGDKLEKLLEKQSEVQNLIDRSGGWAWEHRVENILARLQISKRDMQRPIGELSGGNQRRVALAHGLLQKPDLLILDEPTNHLDTETVQWMEEELIQYPGAVLLVTHDRYFLDKVVKRIVEFDKDGVYTYEGNYQTFTEKKIERIRLREQTEQKRLRLMSKELEWLRRSPKARTGKSKARIQRAEEIKNSKVDTRQDSLGLEFRADHRLGGIILEVHGLAKSYGQQKVFEQIHLLMKKKDKIGLLGPNGSGKSTLLSILVGEQRPDSGTIQWGKNTRIAYMNQKRLGLDPNQTVYESLGETDHIRVGERRVHKRTYLNEFLFKREQQQKKISSLSGGEKCRLLLARIMTENANFLILDEPTNDLDILSLQFLEEALLNYQGCLLLVTHDRYFLNKVCNAIFAFEEDGVTRYDGDYDFYKKRLEEKKKEAARLKEPKVKKSKTKEKSTQKRKLSYKEKKEFETIEEDILLLEEERSEIETKLSDPELYKSSPDKARELTEKLEALGSTIETMYARWEELESIANG